MSENNDSKIAVILAVGLIGVAIGLLYLLRLNMSTTPTSTLNSLQSQQSSQLEALYTQRLENILAEKGLSNTNNIDTMNTTITTSDSNTIKQLHL